jgi:hypothetical protein
VVGVGLEVFDDTGGEAVGADAAGGAVVSTRPSGRRWRAVLLARLWGPWSIGLKVGEPVGMAMVGDRVEVAVGPGLDGPEVGQVVRVVVGAELGLRLEAEVCRDIVGDAVGTDVIADAVGETVRPAVVGCAVGEVVATA